MRIFRQRQRINSRFVGPFDIEDVLEINEDNGEVLNYTLDIDTAQKKRPYTQTVADMGWEDCSGLIKRLKALGYTED